MSLTPITFRLKIIEIIENGGQESELLEYLEKLAKQAPLTTERQKAMSKLSLIVGTYYHMYLDNKVEFYKLKEELLK
jgi:hypothetical protein|nr:MAG TPA: hypothetical protein [Caudoviricetes sp.]